MTMLTRWDPWREMNRAQEEMGRLLEDRFVFRAGVLVVHLPKKAEAKPKSIQVKVN